MSNELQVAFQVNAPAGGLDGHMLVILVIMVVAGILGGFANFFLADRQSEQGRREWVRYPLLGVVAALTVPLFLNMISSTLLEGARTKPLDLYVFSGFCLVYVVASRRLFESAVLRLLGQVDQLRRETAQLRQQKAEPAPAAVLPAPEARRPDASVDPGESLSYNDIEILRALAEESFVCGNLAGLCERTGLGRDFVSQRLAAMKALGVIETRINDRNVLHWFVPPRGRQMLDEILSESGEKKVV